MPKYRFWGIKGGNLSSFPFPLLIFGKDIGSLDYILGAGAFGKYGDIVVSPLLPMFIL